MSHEQMTAYLDRFDAIQRRMLDELTDLPRAELKYAADNVRWNTVRRALLRLGDHVREHTTQLAAAREDLGANQTMPQRMLARACADYGAFVGAVVGLEDEALDQVPEPGEWTPRQIIEHMLEIQGWYLGLIRAARQHKEIVDKD